MQFLIAKNWDRNLPVGIPPPGRRLIFWSHKLGRIPKSLVLGWFHRLKKTLQIFFEWLTIINPSKLLLPRKRVLSGVQFTLPCCQGRRIHPPTAVCHWFDAGLLGPAWACCLKPAGYFLKTDFGARHGTSDFWDHFLWHDCASTQWSLGG